MPRILVSSVCEDFRPFCTAQTAFVRFQGGGVCVDTSPSSSLQWSETVHLPTTRGVTVTLMDACLSPDHASEVLRCPFQYGPCAGVHISPVRCSGLRSLALRRSAVERRRHLVRVVQECFHGAHARLCRVGLVLDSVVTDLRDCLEEVGELHAYVESLQEELRASQHALECVKMSSAYRFVRFFVGI